MFTLGQIAEIVGCAVVGDADLCVTGVNPFEEANKGDITLATRKKLLENLESTAASAVIAPVSTELSSKPLLLAENPKLTFARVMSLFHPATFEPTGCSELSSIGSNCKISQNVSIKPFVSIGDDVRIGEEVVLYPGVSVGDRCVIGAGTVIHPNVTVYSDVTIGSKVIIHGGTVIGADGFGYVFDGKEHVKVPQVGRVEIGDSVEIGANSCIDRATFGATIIERGVKIDNHVHIAHNCRIGEGTVIVGCVGISGSVDIGRYCILAGQSGVADHVKIGDNAKIMQKTAVTKDVPAGMKVAGLHGRDYKNELKIEALLRKLPTIYQDLKDLKKTLADLDEELRR